MSDSIGWVSGPIGDVAEQAQGTDAVPSTQGQALDWFSTTKQIARGIGTAAATFGAVDDLGRPIDGAGPEPSISADDANARYGVTPPSGFKPLKFDNPVPESVAKSMYDAKMDELQRNDVATRAPGGAGNAIVRTGLSFATGMLDPVNVAAAFIPVLGEGAVARTLGLEGAESFGAQSAVRLATGAAAGVVQQAPLVGLRYALSQQEQSDYSALDAMSDLAMGGVLGGGLHTAIGAAGDFLGGRFRDSPQGKIVADDPATRDAALRTSVAAVAEDRPVDVSSLIDLGGAEAEHADTLNSLRDEAAGLRHEISQVPGAQPDTATADRLSSIEEELTDPDGTLSQDRRSDLMQEHNMLTEGSAPTDQDVLDEARGASQREGLQTALDRTNQRISDLHDTIAASDAAKRAQGAPDPEFTAVSDSADAAVKASVPAAAPPEPETDAMTNLEATVKAMREPTSTTLDAEWLQQAGHASDSAGSGYNMTTGGAAIRNEVSAALERGDKVTYHVEGKAVPITKVEGGALKDASGQSWGTMPIAAQDAEGVKASGGGNRVEIEGKPQMDAATAAEYDRLTEQAKTDEGTANALQAAAQCMMGRM